MVTLMISTNKVDFLSVYVFPDRRESGKAAAETAAASIRSVLAKKEYANVIFAAAPSQNETFAFLLKEDVDFSRINAFHMDEYAGLPEGHPQSFASYLNAHIFRLAPFHSVNLIPAYRDADTACSEYARLLTGNPPDVVCMGIGENGHIAFNDPGVADFNDEKLIKRVPLDTVCRMQQIHDGCFAALDDVPEYALTLTVPALMSAEYLVCTVPGPTKANAVKQMLQGEIGEACPATALRDHENSFLFLDTQSAAKLG